MQISLLRLKPSALLVLLGFVAALTLTACKSSHEHPAGEHPKNAEHPKK